LVARWRRNVASVLNTATLSADYNLGLSDALGVAHFASRSLHKKALEIAQHAYCDRALGYPFKREFGHAHVVQDLVERGRGLCLGLFDIRFQYVLEGCIGTLQR